MPLSVCFLVIHHVHTGSKGRDSIQDPHKSVSQPKVRSSLLGIAWGAGGIPHLRHNRKEWQIYPEGYLLKCFSFTIDMPFSITEEVKFKNLLINTFL